MEEEWLHALNVIPDAEWTYKGADTNKTVMSVTEGGDSSCMSKG